MMSAFRGRKHMGRLAQADKGRAAWPRSLMRRRPLKGFPVPDDDLAYFERRAEQELQLAQQAVDPQVVAAHYRLAELYLERLSTGRAAELVSAGGPVGELDPAMPPRSR